MLGGGTQQLPHRALAGNILRPGQKVDGAHDLEYGPTQLDVDSEGVLQLDRLRDAPRDLADQRTEGSPHFPQGIDGVGFKGSRGQPRD
jgi:hypothetical protein